MRGPLDNPFGRGDFILGCIAAIAAVAILAYALLHFVG
jgi:hypothetical protein